MTGTPPVSYLSSPTVRPPYPPSQIRTNLPAQTSILAPHQTRSLTKPPMVPRPSSGRGKRAAFTTPSIRIPARSCGQTQVGPGSSLGGIEWGSATDGKRIYVAIANLFGIPYAAGSVGSWAALDPATGAIQWQKADPNGAMDRPWSDGHSQRCRLRPLHGHGSVEADHVCAGCGER